ncbi:MAG: hypothetical protein DRG78_18825 [Epsilonproteobacteria bacterium]|nr:MAG: hypothetical protein DRG78_18825 [Campylobacterota bacterium]
MNYIKLLIILFLLNTSLFSNIDLSQAEKEFIKNHPTITVHNELNWPPYNFNKNGKPLGFSIDYMNLLALKLGIKVKYISGPDWSEFMGMIKDKKIDVMLNIIKTQDRNKVINFTNYYLQSKKAIFTNIPNIQTLDDLNGKTVAVPKDFFIHKFLEKNYPNIKLNIQKNVLDCIIAVMEKQADAIVLNFGVAKYLSEQNGLSFKYITITKDKKLITQLNIGTAKNIPILRDLLQKAMDSLSDKEIQTIHNTWLGVNQTDTKKTSFISTLNNKSQNYLKTKKVIKMCNNPNWEPIEFAQDNDLNNMSGIAIDTIKLLEKKLDVKFENVPTKSWGESQQFLKEKKCDILPCAVETSKRKEYANFTKPYLNLPLAIFTTKDKKVVSGLDEIMDKPWTRQKGSGLITKLKKNYPNMKVIETKGDKEALQYINSGKAYFTIATLPVASHVISKYMLNDLHIAG